MTNVYVNAGHSPNGQPDPGACANGMRECDVTANVGRLVQGYLASAGLIANYEQNDSLAAICHNANEVQADLFVSVHCNAFNGQAKGTETCVYGLGGNSAKLGQCIQSQIVNSLGTVDRGLKERPALYVLCGTNMPACLVELAFIDNEDDAVLLRDKQDEFARAIARGVTDYLQAATPQNSPNLRPAGNETSKTGNLAAGMVSAHFSVDEVSCHCCGKGADVVSPRLLELLEQLRANIGGAIEISCAYRCPKHNAEVGGVPNSQHVLGTAADVQTPNYPHCHTPEQLMWFCEQLPFDGIGLYSWGCHVDVRQGGVGAGIRW